MHAIEVRGMSVDYPRRFKPPLRAVDNLSFFVSPGEIVGFLGVNGAGKSTTIKALMGFQSVSSGTALLFGEPVGGVESRKKIGFLPETATYSPYLTPAETMRLYATLHGIPPASQNELSHELLVRVGMYDYRNQLNKTLSKGMLQRVGIAQALIGTPQLLILDEVSSGLDPIGRRDLRSLLREERDRGATVFFSSHNLGEVESLCDRIFIIHQGRIRDQRKMSDLLSSSESLESHFINIVENSNAQNEEMRPAA